PSPETLPLSSTLIALEAEFMICRHKTRACLRHYLHAARPVAREPESARQVLQSGNIRRACQDGLSSASANCPIWFSENTVIPFCESSAATTPAPSRATPSKCPL